MANWNNISSRGNVEDRRGSARSVSAGVGIGGIALFLLVSYLQTGTINVGTVIDAVSQSQPSTQVSQGTSTEFSGKDSYEVFASTVLGSTNDAWNTQFAKIGKTYTPPHFVLFRGGTASGCGGAYEEVGPHYCPPDQTVYLDETFFVTLRDQFGATGDVAQAYVIAHEVGHHVQTLLKINQESIPQELQADCFAGIWANSIKDKQVFEPGEIKEALDAASAVGDDNIQKRTTGQINYETWTHGSSAERVAAFQKGYTSGSFTVCAGRYGHDARHTGK